MKGSKVFEQIKKLLRVAADGRNCSRSEMETALRKAKEIAMRNDIDIATVSPEEDQKAAFEIVEEYIPPRTKTCRMQALYVISVVKIVFGVEVIAHRLKGQSSKIAPGYTFIGTGSDAATAAAVYDWLHDLFPKLLRKAINDGEISDNTASHRGFYLGLHGGLVEANKRLEKELPADDQQKYALVVVSKKDAISQHMAPMKLSHEKHRKTGHDLQAKERGFHVGRQINLNQIT